jgi:predicted Fe-Mo cluster-binding NifX family protein
VVSESDRIVLAVPSSGDGGIQGQRCEHFGTCERFTIAEIVDGEVGDVRVIDNVPHEEGGCLQPVELLVTQGVTAVIVAAIGPKSAQSLQLAGIKVYFDDQLPYVAQAVGSVRTGRAKLMDAGDACTGCSGGQN